MVTAVCFQAPESFYEDASHYDDQLTFDDMNLSRPILKVTRASDFQVSLKSVEKMIAVQLTDDIK